MMKGSRIAALLFSFVLIASAAGAQAPIGGEFQVNSSPGGNGRTEKYAAVAADAQGRFIVAWARWNGFTHTMLGRRFDAAGVPEGPDFTINTGMVGINDRSPKVAYEANGGFVAVWPGAGIPPGTANVVGRRYDAAGAPRGPEFLVVTTGTQFVAPRVSAGTGGGFVVAWREDAGGGALRARPYDASGVGMATVTFSSGGGSQGGLPDVTMTPDGGFTVAWAPNAMPYIVWARQYDSAGMPRGPAFAASTGTNFKNGVIIASDAAGNFTVAWHDSGPPQGDDAAVIRKFAANGAALTGEIQVNTFLPGFQGSGDFAMGPGGDLMVPLQSVPMNFNCPPPPLPCTQPPAQDGSGSGIFGRRFDPSGAPVTGEFAVNTSTIGEQVSPGAAMDSTGRVTVVWEDTQRNAIYARRFGALVPSALDVDRVAGAGSNGNRVFEAGETVAIEPSWRNTTSVPLTFSGATASLAGPAGPTYTMLDADASYGTFPAGASASCRDQGDCYSASIAGSRPAPHWDALLNEAFVPAGHASKTWKVHVGQSFADVPLSSPFYRFVETILHNDVTGGCGIGVYCPATSVPREQMPVFVLRSYLPTLVPQACVAGSERFGDVPASSPYCRWIEELARRGVVAGCGGGNYCPSATVSRETMAVYLGATLALNPPACGTPIFGDVPASSPFCRWIEELARRGVVGGCGGGNYCPTMPVAREQMAVFLSVTFGLVLYGP